MIDNASSRKKISCKADLAIYGAPPAFENPVHVGRPNIGNREEFLEKINKIIDNKWLTNDGPMVQEFERRIAKHLNVKHCIAMCNGTIALEIAIRALGLQGEVIVPSWTFIATAHSLFWQGITPIFADIDPNTHNLDPAAVRRMITPRTTGIIGVHLWGRAAPVNELQALAEEHQLKLMFDSAHAFGCSYRGESIGQFGSCEVFSFHATKSFNAMEGGAVTTNDDNLANTARLMRNFGFSGYDNVIYPGTNGKMIEACAAMGLVNLDNFTNIVDSNKKNYTAYHQELKDLKGVRLLSYSEQEKNNYHYIILEVNEECAVRRDDIIAALHAENILARKYFWPGCHMMRPYRDLYPHAGLVLPNTSEVSKKVIVLPNSGISCDEAEDISRIIRIYVNS